MRFSHADVVRFAAWSGDRNPLHVDAGFARQTYLELEFRNAVLVDGEYLLDSSDTPDGFAVTLRGGGHVVLTIHAQTGAPTEPEPEQDLDLSDLSWARAIAAGGATFTTAMRESPAQHGPDPIPWTGQLSWLTFPSFSPVVKTSLLQWS